jgi:hypothetical protein
MLAAKSHVKAGMRVAAASAPAGPSRDAPGVAVQKSLTRDLDLVLGEWAATQGTAWNPVATAGVDDTWSAVRFKFAPGLEKVRIAGPKRRRARQRRARLSPSLVEHVERSVEHDAGRHGRQHGVTIDAHPVAAARRSTQAPRTVIVDHVRTRVVRHRQPLAANPAMRVVAVRPVIAVVPGRPTMLEAFGSATEVVAIDVVTARTLPMLIAVALTGVSHGRRRGDERDDQGTDQCSAVHIEPPVIHVDSTLGQDAGAPLKPA